MRPKAELPQRPIKTLCVTVNIVQASGVHTILLVSESYDTALQQFDYSIHARNYTVARNVSEQNAL